MLQLLIALMVGSMLVLASFNWFSQFKRQQYKQIVHWQHQQNVVEAADILLSQQSHILLDCSGSSLTQRASARKLKRLTATAISIEQAKSYGWPLLKPGKGSYVKGPVLIVNNLKAPVYLPSIWPGQQQLELIDSIVQVGDQLVFTDCRHTETIAVQAISHQSNKKIITLARPNNLNFRAGAQVLVLHTYVFYLGSNTQSEGGSLYDFNPLTKRRVELLPGLTNLTSRSNNGQLTVSIHSGKAQEQVWLRSEALY